jgi:hypothetical protein
MNKQKYFESNVLIAQRKGLPNIVQQKLIISDEDKELARECFLYLKDQILQRSAGGISGKSNNPVWIPFGQLLAEILPSNKGSDSRNTNRIFALLNIIPLTRAHLRPKLVYGLEILVVATLEDLREVLHITQDVTGMAVYKLKFYREVFLPLFRSKRTPTVDNNNGKSEPRIALTSREICDYCNSIRDTKPLTTDSLKKTFLDELLNHGYIEQETSTINAKQNIYYPLIDIEDKQTLSLSIQDQNGENATSISSNEPGFDKDFQLSKLILPANCKRIPDNWLNLEILELMTYRADPKFRLLDEKGNQLCICSFAKKYENSLRLSRFIKMPQDATFSKIFGAGIKEIATKSPHLHNNESNLEQFDEKDNNITAASACAGLDESFYQPLSKAAALKPGHDNNTPIRKICAKENAFSNKSQQRVTDGLKDDSSSLLQDYVAFDLEWTNNNDDSGIESQTIYAAAFVDNHGNQKVLHISDFANSESALLQEIIGEILKYSASMGWYTTGIARGSCNSIGRRGGASVAA